jgi:hypothetical protein
VLRVGGIGVNGHRTAAQLFNQALVAFGLDPRRPGALLLQALCAQATDTDTKQPIGQKSALGEAQ